MKVCQQDRDKLFKFFAAAVFAARYFLRVLFFLCRTYFFSLYNIKFCRLIIAFSAMYTSAAHRLLYKFTDIKLQEKRGKRTRTHTKQRE